MISKQLPVDILFIVRWCHNAAQAGCKGVSPVPSERLRLGIHRMEVYEATRAHRGYWFMAETSIVQRALDNRWLSERGVPSLKEQGVQMHYGRSIDPEGSAAVNLTGTA